MLYLTLTLAVIVLLLVILRERDLRCLERVYCAHAAQVEAIRTDTAAQLAVVLEQAAAERQSLLDRIQHPERVQVQPVEREPVEPPRDSAELAFVGGIVPDGVQVGTRPDGD